MYRFCWYHYINLFLTSNKLSIIIQYFLIKIKTVQTLLWSHNSRHCLTVFFIFFFYFFNIKPTKLNSKKKSYILFN